ncbi:DUF5317 family protein [Clostridium gasigenes]|uniref:DUF5317 family protein n=1 Tax=Clostridium gasigenes TaxID=94869 RepID=UPI001C0E77B3|nr:DUF5317 family protein [Clostridium gasigenes]MBU3105915.1 DUF5317 domain-containing protein [Clostridium gasigenes]
MVETIIIALIVAKIKDYKIKPLFKTWAIYPVIFMELVSLVIQICIFNEYYEVIKYAGILKTIYLCSYLPLIFKYEQYISAIIGSIVMVVGGLLNNLAMHVNKGMMPVFPKLSYVTGYATVESFNKVNDIHILGNSETKLKFLTDIFDIGYSILSLGDVFIRFYVFIIIFKSVKHINKTIYINSEKIQKI